MLSATKKTDNGVVYTASHEDIYRKDILPMSDHDFTLKVLIDNKVPIKVNPGYLKHSNLSLNESPEVQFAIDRLGYLRAIHSANTPQDPSTPSPDSPTNPPSTDE